MNIVADENVDKQIVDRLRSDGHDVVFFAEYNPGSDDEAVLLKSRNSGAMLLTADKDFGELVFRFTLAFCCFVLRALIRKPKRTLSPRRLLSTAMNYAADLQFYRR